MRAHIFFFAAILLSGSAYPTTIHVPGDQPTIQAGINSARDGDTATDSIQNEKSKNVLTVGKRIRVLVPGVVYHRTLDRRLYPATGIIVALHGDTIVFDGERLDSLATIPLSTIQLLEVSKGKRPQALQYGAIGFLVGAVAGFLVAPALTDKGEEGLAVARGIYAAIGGGLGLLVSVIWSIEAPSEKWENVPLEEVKIGLMPLRDRGFVIRASVSF